jgi:hypothetical protein
MGVAATVGFAVIVSTNPGSKVGTALRNPRQMAYGSSEHFGLSADPVLKGIPALNIDVTPFWDTMWAMYFLADKRLYLESDSYYHQSPAEADWTLVPRVGAMRGPAVHDINSLFRVLHDDASAPESVEVDALDGDVTVSIDQSSLSSGIVRGVVSAENVGRARWLPPSAGTGAVAVGVHLEDADGRMVDYEWSRVALIPERKFNLPPDSTTEEPFTLPPLAPGHYRLGFELVSEDVTWFGIPAVADIVVP